MASAIASRLDGLSEVTELERIPLPYKTLYHTLVFKNDMPVDLLKERHQTGTQQLLIWIQAALKLVDTVVESQLLQRSQRREEHLELLNDDEDEEQEELEIEIQDMVSGFGHYEPTIESSIEILLQLEECISNRTSTSNKPKEPTSPSSLSVASSSLSLSSTTSLSGYTPPATHHSPEIEQVMGQWSRLRDTVGGLGGAIREHQRIRDGIQSVNNIAEQTHQATQLLEKCLKAIAQDKRNCRHAFEEGLTNLEAKGGLDGNDMLELDSMVGLLSLQIESLQTSFPECVSATNNKSLPYSSQAHFEVEHGGLAHKKTIMASLYQDLLVDWSSLRRRKEQLWRDLEECDRWRARIEKMARQIESMLEPVEIFHKMCANLLGSLEEKSGSQHLMVVNEEDQEVQSPKPESLSSWPSIPIEEPSQADLEMLASTLQELEEKQNMVAPAIENMFWVQEGEIQHRTKHVVHSPSTPSTAIPPSLPHSPMDTFAGSPLDFSSPLYPNLPMLERQRGLKARWSNLKASLDTAGTQLQQHHVTMTERANAFLAMKKRQAEEAAAAAAAAAARVQEEKARISTEVSEPSTSTLRRSFTNSSRRSSSVISNTSTRILRGTLVPSISMDSPTVKKYMLLKGDKPASSKPRPWCPSINPQSPGLPGFPVQTSSWGYFLISTSQSMDSFGSVIATPAPVPIAPPPAPTPPPPKFNRPPFSPAGPRLYTKPTPPTRPAPQRSASVAGGDYSRNRCMSPTISWENKMVRRSNSMAFDDKSPKSTNRNTRQGNNNQSKSGRKGSFSSAKDGSSSATHAGRRNSNASDCNAWYGNHHRHSIDNSSSEDETVTGEFHTNNRMSRGYKNFNKQGLRTRTKQNDSSSSLDSMMSSSGYSYGGRGYSSLSSHGELRSPSPPLPLPYPSAFGSSFAAARSTAALHTALLSSMSSHSSSSFRNSALSFSSSQRTDSRQSEHDGPLSSKHSSGSSLLSRRQVYHQESKPSSWMGSGSLISALSFRVPTYSFEEDFGSFEATAHEGAVVN